MPPSILLIDDSPGESELFRQALAQSGYAGRLDITDGSLSAMRHLTDQSNGDEPALIVLDLKLRGERGLDLLKELKQHPHYAHIPIVILTSSDDGLDIRDGYGAGANGYVVKPGQYQDLVTVVLHLWKFWVEHNCTLRRADPC